MQQEKNLLILYDIDGDIDEHKSVDDQHDKNWKIKPEELVKFTKEQAGPNDAEYNKIVFLVKMKILMAKSRTVT